MRFRCFHWGLLVAAVAAVACGRHLSAETDDGNAGPGADTSGGVAGTRSEETTTASRPRTGVMWDGGSSQTADASIVTTVDSSTGTDVSLPQSAESDGGMTATADAGVRCLSDLLAEAPVQSLEICVVKTGPGDLAPSLCSDGTICADGQEGCETSFTLADPIISFEAQGSGRRLVIEAVIAGLDATFPVVQDGVACSVAVSPPAEESTARAAFLAASDSCDPHGPEHEEVQVLLGMDPYAFGFEIRAANASDLAACESARSDIVTGVGEAIWNAVLEALQTAVTTYRCNACQDPCEGGIGCVGVGPSGDAGQGSRDRDALDSGASCAGGGCEASPPTCGDPFDSANGECWKGCTADSDCVLIETSCCDCSNGGQRVAIRGDRSEQWPFACTAPADGCLASYDCSCPNGFADAQPICDNGRCAIRCDPFCIDDHTWAPYRADEISQFGTLCTPYRCEPAGCLTTCSSTADCATGFKCDLGATTCLPQDGGP